MKETEGVIRYELDHRPGELPTGADYAGLFRWFRRCREDQLIGRDPARYDGFAFGNISVRASHGFVISATQTGGLAALRPDNLAWVEAFDARANRLTACGAAKPSSEAMTHGQVYAALDTVNAVIHVHSPLLWRHAAALDLPITDPSAAYGTPEMAAEVERLLLQSGPVAQGLFVMGGHEDGVVSYAADIDTAGRLLLDALDAARTRPGDR